MTASDEDAVVVDAAAPEEDGAAEAAVPESDAAAAAPSASPSAAPGAYQVAALSDSESEGAAGAHAAAVADSDEEAEAGKKRRRRGHELDEEDYDLLEQNNVVGVRRPAEQPRKRLQKAGQATAQPRQSIQTEQQLKATLFGDDDEDDALPAPAPAAQQPHDDMMDEDEDEMGCAHCLLSPAVCSVTLAPGSCRAAARARTGVAYRLE